MAAEHDWPGFADGGADAGPPEFFSVGANFATACADDVIRTHWNPLAPLDVRRRQRDRYYRHAPRDAFAPFSRAGWFGSLVELGFEVCLSWPGTPDANIVLSEGDRYPDVPTLMLSGEYDDNTPMEDGDLFAKRWPGLVAHLHVAGAGHTAPGWSACARRPPSRSSRRLPPRTCSATSPR